MKKLFLCHASEDKNSAEPIQLALVNAGYEVFYDEKSLPPGSDYHGRINEAIDRCDIFIFLISKASIEPGKYTLTELALAQDKWPSPADYILPVNLENIPLQVIPHYLSSTTILEIKGNAAADVRRVVKSILIDRKRRLGNRNLKFGVVISLLSLIVTIFVSFTLHYRMPKVCGDFTYLVGSEEGGYWTTKWDFKALKFTANGRMGQRKETDIEVSCVNGVFKGRQMNATDKNDCSYEGEIIGNSVIGTYFCPLVTGEHNFQGSLVSR